MAASGDLIHPVEGRVVAADMRDDGGGEPQGQGYERDGGDALRSPVSDPCPNRAEPDRTSQR